jgi:hypothetical protein
MTGAESKPAPPVPGPRPDDPPSVWCWYVLAGRTRDERKSRLQQITDPDQRETVAGLVITHWKQIAKDDARAT